VHIGPLLPRCLHPLGLVVCIGFLLAPLPHQTGSVLRAEAQEKPADPSLASLIHTYLNTHDPDQAERVEAEILNDPRATIAAMTNLIAQEFPQGAAPVGLQPSQPVTVLGQTSRYGLYVPPSYSPDKAYALVLCLHGAGFTGDAYLERWHTRLGDGYILACPTYLQGAWWTRRGEELVLATLRAVQAHYRIDPDRIFLTGMSNGGIGTYLIGSHHADLFAGLADTVLLPFLENLANTPLYLIHGRQDQVMPVELSRTIAQELTRLGYTFHYQEHDRVHPMAGGHFFPREELPALVRWFDGQRRTALPTHVTVVRDATHLTPFSWVRIDATDRIAAFTDLLTDSRDEAIVNRRYARVDVRIVGTDRIEVRTERVKRYSLYLNDNLVDISRPITVVTNGRIGFHGSVEPRVDTLLRNARQRQDRHRLFPVLLHLTVEDGP
jgi:dienelactone hydrolase